MVAIFTRNRLHMPTRKRFNLKPLNYQGVQAAAREKLLEDFKDLSEFDDLKNIRANAIRDLRAARDEATLANLQVLLIIARPSTTVLEYCK